MNLLKNANFDEGYHHQDNIPEIVVPNEWHLYWIDNEVFEGAESAAYRPESVIWDIHHVQPHERHVFFLNSNSCWKVFKANAPVYFAATQVVSDLTPGATYRFNAKVYPDIVAGYSGGQKVRPDDSEVAEARAGWSAPDTPWPQAADGDVTWSTWFNAHNHNLVLGEHNDVWVEFVAPASGVARVWVESKAKKGFENNWVMNSFSLQRVGEILTPPTASPRHVEYTVKRGDTLRSIAQYHRVNVQTIMVTSGLRDHHIQVGQVLTIPLP